MAEARSLGLGMSVTLAPGSDGASWEPSGTEFCLPWLILAVGNAELCPAHHSTAPGQSDRRGVDGRRLRLARARQDGEQFRSQLLTSTEKETPVQILPGSEQHQDATGLPRKRRWLQSRPTRYLKLPCLPRWRWRLQSSATSRPGSTDGSLDSWFLSFHKKPQAFLS